MSIYTISSEDSDDNLDGVPPLVGPGDKGSCEDPDAVLMCQESNANNVFNGRSLPCETDMDDDNAPVLENNSRWNRFSVSQHSSRSPDDDMVLPDDPLSDGSISNDQFVLGSIPTSATDFNNVKRKSAGSPKAKNDKTSNTALERQAKKQKLADERAARRTAAGINKMYRPGECMKYINIEGHPDLLSRWYMANVSNEVSQLGAHVLQAIRLVHPAVLVWSRTIPRTLDTEGGQVRLSPLRQPCERALYVADAEELCEMVSSHTLSSHLSQIRQLCDCKLTLLVFNVRDYFKKKGGSTQPSVHSAPRRRTSNSNRTPMTEIEFELAVTDLLVTANCDTMIANTASELASSIVQMTKAVAAAPAKKAQQDCDDKAGFFMRGDNKNCVAVDKDGVGVGRLWQQMLAILPQSSLETSRAICAQYRSPLALYESLQSSDSIAQLADIGVSRTGVEGSRARRVGPEFARKLHTLFTATDGNQIIE